MKWALHWTSSTDSMWQMKRKYSTEWNLKMQIFCVVQNSVMSVLVNCQICTTYMCTTACQKGLARYCLYIEFWFSEWLSRIDNWPKTAHFPEKFLLSDACRFIQLEHCFDFEKIFSDKVTHFALSLPVNTSSFGSGLLVFFGLFVCYLLKILWSYGLIAKYGLFFVFSNENFK